MVWAEDENICAPAVNASYRNGEMEGGRINAVVLDKVGRRLRRVFIRRFAGLIGKMEVMLAQGDCLSHQAGRRGAVHCRDRAGACYCADPPEAQQGIGRCLSGRSVMGMHCGLGSGGGNIPRGAEGKKQSYRCNQCQPEEKRQSSSHSVVNQPVVSFRGGLTRWVIRVPRLRRAIEISRSVGDGGNAAHAAQAARHE